MAKKKTAPRCDLSAEFVRSILDYDKATGKMIWKIDRPPRGKAGRPAGINRGDGRIVIGIGGRMYLAYRLAWLIVTGEWPKHQIDHANKNSADMRWENLREASHSENLYNQGPTKRNKSGIKGVYKRKDCNRWTAFIQANKKCVYLGLFRTKEEAEAAHKAAAAKLHGKFSRFR